VGVVLEKQACIPENIWIPRTVLQYSWQNNFATKVLQPELRIEKAIGGGWKLLTGDLDVAAAYAFINFMFYDSCCCYH